MNLLQALKNLGQHVPGVALGGALSIADRVFDGQGPGSVPIRGQMPQQPGSPQGGTTAQRASYSYANDGNYTPLQGSVAAPDITFNPNPNTNIPYSTHDQALAQHLAQIQQQGVQGGTGFGVPMQQPFRLPPAFQRPQIPQAPQIRGYGVNGNNYVDNGI